MPQVSLTEFVERARSAELVSFPTDTVPALAVRPDRAELIFAAKQRSETKPLILMGAAAVDLWPYVSGSEAELTQWQSIARQYWPGALTLVLPASERLPKAMNPTDPTTIGIRVPHHPVAQRVLALTEPLATTSVNRSGEPPLQTMVEIQTQFPAIVTLSPAELTALAAFDQAPAQDGCASGVPSTVAKWTGTGWEILRQGKIQLSL